MAVIDPSPRPPTGPAGGGLSGTYPNPTVVPGTPGAHTHPQADVTNLVSDLAARALTTDIRFPAGADIVDSDIAAANKDGLAATASMRTLGTGAQQAAAGNDVRLSDCRTPCDGTVTDAKVAAANKDGLAATPSMRTIGAGAQQVVAGNDPRLTDRRVPVLLSVTNAEVSATAAIAESKLSLASDAAAGTASRRTLGTGALQATAGNDARLSDSRTPLAHTHAQADVTNLVSDLAAKAPLASPALTGTPTAPTAAAATNTTQLATTAFVTTADNLKANLASPTFTGTPAAPTAAVDTNTTQLATTGFVIGQGYLKSSTAASTYQPLDSDLTSIAALTTTAFGRSLLTQADAAATRTTIGAAATSHTHAQADVTNLVSDLALKAPLASPPLTGTPTAPTAAAGTNTTQIATTANVVATVAPKAPSASPTFTGTVVMPQASFSPSYTPDGVWHANAVPSLIIPATGSASFKFGYADNGSGSYVPSMGFATTSAAGSQMGLPILQTRQTDTDSANRFQIEFGGTHWWGPGTAALDTNLYRSAANLLKTDDDFVAAGDIGARSTAATQVTLGSVGGVPGILFGSAADTNLYRSAANVLKTDDDFQAASVTAGTFTPDGGYGMTTETNYLKIFAHSAGYGIVFRDHAGNYRGEINNNGFWYTPSGGGIVADLMDMDAPNTSNSTTAGVRHHAVSDGLQVGSNYGTKNTTLSEYCVKQDCLSAGSWNSYSLLRVFHGAPSDFRASVFAAKAASGYSYIGGSTFDNVNFISRGVTIFDQDGGSDFQQASDAVLKKNIRSVKQTDALGKLRKLRYAEFDWAENANTLGYQGPGTGFVAQEVEEVFPEAVRVLKETPMPDGGESLPERRTLQPMPILGAVVAALQAIDERLAALEEAA